MWLKMRTTKALPEMELSPLEQIRFTEAEVAGAIAAARQAAERVVADAHSEAARLKREAHEQGTREGQAKFKAAVTQAEEEARIFLDDAHQRSRELRRQGQKWMKSGVEYAISIVLSLDEEEKLA